MYIGLKNKYDELLKEKTPVNQKVFDELSDEYNKVLLENTTLKSNVDKLKSFIGLVEDNEYGIVKKSLIYGDKNEKIDISAEFKAIQRGLNKVKISLNIDTIKTHPNEMSNKKLISDIKEYIDGWYDIDDGDITWVIPDKKVKREFDIDNILGD